MFGMIVGILFEVYVIAVVINVVGMIIGAVFSGVGALFSGIFSGVFSLAEGVFSWEGILLGIALGLAWYFLRKRNEANAANTATVREG